jgi:AraC-like DNA-binding protein
MPAPDRTARADRDRWIAAVAEANPAKSVRALAREFGLSKSHVQRILKQENPAKVRKKGRRPRLKDRDYTFIANALRIHIHPSRLAIHFNLSERTIYRAIAKLKKDQA